MTRSFIVLAAVAAGCAHPGAGQPAATPVNAPDPLAATSPPAAAEPTPPPPPQQAPAAPESVPAAASAEGDLGDSYASYLHEAVRAHWLMPNGVALEGPPVRVSVRILADGAVADLRVKRSSGDPAFDEACLEAVRAAAPLKPPPEAVRRTYARGVLLEFERRDLAR